MDSAHEHDVRQFFKDLSSKDVEWEVDMAKYCFEENMANGHLFWHFAWARGGESLFDLTGGRWEDDEEAGAGRGSSPPDLA